MGNINLKSHTLKGEKRKDHKTRIMIFQVLSYLIIFLMWSKAFLSYLDFPEQIPLSFGIEGRPSFYGNKIFIFILCFSLSIIPQFILVLILLRKKIARKRKIKEWDIDGYFIPIAETNFLISTYVFITFYGITFGIKEGKIPFWFFPFLLLTPIIITSFFLIRTIIILYKITTSKSEEKT